MVILQELLSWLDALYRRSIQSYASSIHNVRRSTYNCLVSIDFSLAGLYTLNSHFH